MQYNVPYYLHTYYQSFYYIKLFIFKFSSLFFGYPYNTILTTYIHIALSIFSYIFNTETMSKLSFIYLYFIFSPLVALFIHLTMLISATSFDLFFCPQSNISYYITFVLPQSYIVTFQSK